MNQHIRIQVHTLLRYLRGDQNGSVLAIPVFTERIHPIVFLLLTHKKRQAGVEKPKLNIVCCTGFTQQSIRFLCPVHTVAYPQYLRSLRGLVQTLGNHLLLRGKDNSNAFFFRWRRRDGCRLLPLPMGMYERVRRQDTRCLWLCLWIEKICAVFLGERGGKDNDCTVQFLQQVAQLLDYTPGVAVVAVYLIQNYHLSGKGKAT